MVRWNGTSQELAFTSVLPVYRTEPGYLRAAPFLPDTDTITLSHI